MSDVDLFSEDFDLSNRPIIEMLQNGTCEVFLVDGNVSVISDAHVSNNTPITPEIISREEEKIKTQNIKLVVLNGDIAELFNPKFWNNMSQSLRDAIDPCSGNLYGLFELYERYNIPVIIIPGNHDPIEVWKEVIPSNSFNLIVAKETWIYYDNVLSNRILHLHEQIPSFQNLLENLGLKVDYIPAFIANFFLNLKHQIVEFAESDLKGFPLEKMFKQFATQIAYSDIENNRMRALIQDAKEKGYVVIGGHVHKVHELPNLLTNRHLSHNHQQSTWSEIIISPSGSSVNTFKVPLNSQ